MTNKLTYDNLSTEIRGYQWLVILLVNIFKSIWSGRSPVSPTINQTTGGEAMSINVYLKKDEVKKHPDFETIPRQGGDQSWEEYELLGFDLSYDKGRWYFTLHEPTDPIPETIKNIIEEISLRETLPVSPARERGLYRYKTAEAEIETGLSDKREKYNIRIIGKNMEDILTLFRKIKAGSIRPRPEESWEGKQSGKSLNELEEEVGQLKQKLEKANSKIVETEKKLVEWPFFK